MDLRLRIVIFTVGLSLLLYGAANILHTFNITLDLKSPLSNGFGLSSLFGKHKNTDNFVYGFLPYWNLDDAKNFRYEDLTDIAYFGIRINSDGSIARLDSSGNAEPGYAAWKNSQDLTEIISKAKQNGVRVSLTVISHEDNTTENFLNCESCWETLEKNVLTELNYRKIDDVHLNFEYSTYTTKEMADKFTKFTKHFDNYLAHNHKNSILVISAFADSNIKSRLTNIKELSPYVDGIFIMGYDFRTRGSEFAGPVAPLDGIGTVATYDIRNTVKDYIANAPKSKIILGVPYYGYNWPVESTQPYSRQVDSNVLGYASDSGAKSQTYADIMTIIEEYNIKPSWDEVSKVPYFSYYSPQTQTYRQIYYEDKKSLALKFKYAKDSGIGGIGIWALGYDGNYVDLWDLLKEY